LKFEEPEASTLAAAAVKVESENLLEIKISKRRRKLFFCGSSKRKREEN
jgi:hypothetical protein